MQYTAEELNKLPSEELMKIKEKLLAENKQLESQQKVGGFLGGMGNSFLGGLRGDWKDKPKEDDMAEKINTMMATEAIKNKYNPPKYQPSTKEEALDFEREKLGIKGADPAKELLNEIQREKLENIRQKQADAAKRQELSVETIKNAAQDRLNTISQIEKGLNYFGPVGGLPSQATTLFGLNKKEYANRKTWENATNRLLSQLGFDMMTELKNASRTGATGLGQLSEKEGEWLRQASTELTRDTTPERAKQILDEMKRLHKKVLEGGGGLSDGDQSIGKIITAPNGKQYRVIGGDPNDPDVEEI